MSYAVLRIRIRIFPSRIRIKEFKYFNPKKWFLSSKKYDPGCSSRIQILTFYPSRIQGSKRHRIPDPDPQHWSYVFCVFRLVAFKRWLWAVIERMSGLEKQDLVYFWTGSPALPASEEGFQPMPSVTIRFVSSEYRL